MTCQTGDMKIEQKHKDWFRGTDTGISSNTIFGVMTGTLIAWTGYPADPDDFSRCYRLLARFPEWRPRIHEVSEEFPNWERLVNNWENLERLYRAHRKSQNYDMWNFMCLLDERSTDKFTSFSRMR